MFYCYSVVQKTWLCSRKHIQQPNVLRFCVSSLFCYICCTGGLLSRAHAVKEELLMRSLQLTWNNGYQLLVGYVASLACLITCMQHLIVLVGFGFTPRDYLSTFSCQFEFSFWLRIHMSTIPFHVLYEYFSLLFCILFVRLVVSNSDREQPFDDCTISLISYKKIDRNML